MKVNYKGCELEAYREQSCAGYEMIFYSIFDDGYEVACGFSEGNDTVKEWIEFLKNITDDYKSMTRAEWEDLF